MASWSLALPTSASVAMRRASRNSTVSRSMSSARSAMVASAWSRAMVRLLTSSSSSSRSASSCSPDSSSASISLSERASSSRVLLPASSANCCAQSPSADTSDGGIFGLGCSAGSAWCKRHTVRCLWMALVVPPPKTSRIASMVTGSRSFCRRAAAAATSSNVTSWPAIVVSGSDCWLHHKDYITIQYPLAYQQEHFMRARPSHRPATTVAAGLPHQVVGNLEGGIWIVLLHRRAGLFDPHHQLDRAALADDHQAAGDQVRLHSRRYIDALDLVVVRVVVGDVAVALGLAILQHHLRDLRHDGLLIGGRVALRIELAGPLGVLALRLQRGHARLVDALRAGAALDLLLLALVLVGQFGLGLVDQAGF